MGKHLKNLSHYPFSLKARAVILDYSRDLLLGDSNLTLNIFNDLTELRVGIRGTQ